MKVKRGQTGSVGTQGGSGPVEQVVEVLGLGGAKVTLRELLTHGPASVAEQKLCRRFHIPGLGGQR